MSSPEPRSTPVLLAAALLAILCCTVGPAVLAVAAWSVIGGWLGVACAVAVAETAGVALRHRHRRRGF